MHPMTATLKSYIFRSFNILSAVDPNAGNGTRQTQFSNRKKQQTNDTETDVPRAKCSAKSFGSRHMFLLSVITFLSLFFALPAQADQVSLAWDANAPTPSGYRLYQREAGQAYDYSNPVWTGTQTTCTLPDLTEGTQYYFVVRAYAGDEESGDSNEATYLAQANQPPVANAGVDLTVSGSTLVTLDGSTSSDPDNDLLTYAWTQLNGTTVTLSDAAAVAPSFSAPASAVAIATLTFQLTVTDPSGLSSSDTCTVYISATAPVNEAPVAEAGSNQTVVSGNTVQLNGSQSADPNGDAMTYYWTQNGGPAVQLSSTSAINPTFTAPTVNAGDTATLIFELTVTDAQAASGADTCIVLVTAAAPADSDGDGVADDQDAFPDDPSESVDTDSDGTGNNADTDDDNDGMPDDWELQYGLNPLADDSALDSDQDGVSNIDEYTDGTDPSEADNNQAPVQPGMLIPADGDIDIETTVKLQATEFSDPDADDYHAQTEWLILAENGQDIVLHIYRDKGKLTEYRLPRLTLDPNTTYICRVRYYDNQNEASAWSEAVTFTTMTSKNDKNSNGVLDEQDVSATTDLNLNGTPDLEETRYTRSVIALDSAYMMSVSVEDNDAEVTVDGAGVIDPDTIEDSPDMENVHTYGLFTFRIKVQEAGQEITARIFLSDGVADDTEWVSITTDDDWTNCQSEVTRNTDGYSIQRSLKDGGEDDADGVANGIIISTMAPVLKDSGRDQVGDNFEDSDSLSDPGTPSSQGCFIGSLLN